MRYYSDGTVKKIMKGVKVDYVQTSQYDSSLCTEERKYPRLENFPSIEIPDNHGRLKDTDAIISKIERMVHPDDLTYTIAHGILKQIIEDAETIVEATE